MITYFLKCKACACTLPLAVVDLCCYWLSKKRKIYQEKNAVELCCIWVKSLLFKDFFIEPKFPGGCVEEHIFEGRYRAKVQGDAARGSFILQNNKGKDNEEGGLERKAQILVIAHRTTQSLSPGHNNTHTYRLGFWQAPKGPAAFDSYSFSPRSLCVFPHS